MAGGVLAVAGIVGWLAATGLRAGHLDPRPGILQKLDRGEADARPEQIDQAGDEQADQRALLCIGRGQSHVRSSRALHPVAGGGSEDVASAARTQEIGNRRGPKREEGRDMLARALALTGTGLLLLVAASARAETAAVVLVTPLAYGTHMPGLGGSGDQARQTDQGALGRLRFCST